MMYFEVASDEKFWQRRDRGHLSRWSKEWGKLNGDGFIGNRVGCVTMLGRRVASSCGVVVITLVVLATDVARNVGTCKRDEPEGDSGS
jgi:hypothetical protein